MASRMAYVLLIALFSFSLWSTAINDIGLFEDTVVAKEMPTSELNDSIYEIQDFSDTQASDNGVIGTLIDGGEMVIKGFALLIVATLKITVLGLYLTTYGVPVAIAAVFEGLNLLILAYLYAEFVSGRNARA
jgi:hypothetical protein